MAMKSVETVVNGQRTTLNWNSSTSKYEGTVTAPSASSFNQSGGYYGVQIIAEDIAGNKTTVDQNHATLGSSLRLTVKEKVKPTIAIVSPGAGAMLNSNKPTVTAQLRDADSGIKINTLALKINGGVSIGNAAVGMTCTQVAGGYDITYVVQTALSDGNNSFTIDIQDNDGNVATQATRSFTIDTTPPTLNVTSPADGLVTNATTVNVVGTTNDLTSSPVTVKITLNGVDQGAVTLDGSGNFDKSITLVAGTNTIVVTSTDSATRATSVTRTVVQDKTPPVITAIEMVPNPVDGGLTFVIRVTATD